jgi:hypothetical protein
MKYRIEFTDTDGTRMTKAIRHAENDNEAIEEYKKFEEELKINPGYKVTGLVKVEIKEVLTRILPRSPV